MNIAFFITPKSEIVTLKEKMTIRQAMEKMSYHKYSAVPVINELGQYVFALSEGDILWHLKDNEHKVFKDTEKEMISNINRHRDMAAVSINEDIESLIECAIHQSFVPVVDDQNIFIGIIKRSDLINYCLLSKDFSKSVDSTFVAS
ncbi:MAG: CBS domain-containing protein [Vallitaleaceae bacterium]|jgi:CBS domain-containing protein|nr:CBS domain-containing protein [Vallitaleaceae bacterium]